MMRLIQRSATVSPPRHMAPGSWHDLKRDWHRWSRAERLAAELIGLGVLLGAAAGLALFPFA